MAHSGLRMNSIDNYLGNDGLTDGDILEMMIENDQVLFEKMTTMLLLDQA